MRHVHVHVEDQFYLFVHQPCHDDVGHIIKQAHRLVLHRVDIHLARFDLGEIQYVIDDGKKRSS